MKKIIVLAFIIPVIFLIKDSLAQGFSDGVTPKPLTVSITAKGTVLSPISIVSTRDLDFGNEILPGINKTVDKNSGNSGKFSILGQPGKEISIVISAPGELFNGNVFMPMSFSSTDAGYMIPGGSIVEFDPAAPVNAVFGPEGSMDVYLGGTVVPNYTQEGGEYQGTVTVVFYYTGN